MSIRVAFMMSVVVMAGLLAPAIAAAEPYGDPFRLSDSSSGDQMVWDVATGANGDSALLWWNDGGQFITRYDAKGRPLQSRALPVATDVYQVAVSGTGSFATLRAPRMGNGRDIFAKVYDRAGNELLPEFQVNEVIPGERIHTVAQVAMNASGQFVIVWQRWSPSGSGTTAMDIFARRYQANGAPNGPALLVRTTGFSALSDDVGIDNQGNFVVIWNEVVANGWSVDLYARRYSSTGTPLSSPYVLSYGETQPTSIVMNGSGAFVLAANRLISTNNWGLYARRYSANGTFGGEVYVSDQPGISPLCPQIGIASNNSFVVSWTDKGTSTQPLPRILSRSYDANGVALGAPTAVNTGTSGMITSDCAPLGVDPAGNTIVGWSQYDSAASANGWEALARRYLPAGVVVQSLTNGQSVTGLSSSTNSWRYFKLSVPTGQSTVDVSITGGTGDADLYVRWGALPTLTAWDGRPYLNGNSEGVRMLNFPAGDWYIGVQGFSTYSGLTLQASSR